MAPLHEGLQVVSAASRNARTCWEVQPYGTFFTYSSRLGLLDCNVAVAVAVAALCAANANPCAAPLPPTAGALATPPNCAPSAPWNANAWPDWAMFMPAICFMIWSFARASCTERLGFLAHDHRQRETLRHADDVFVVARVAPPPSSLLLGPRVGHAVAASSPSSSTPRAVPSSPAAAAAAAVSSSSVAAHDLFVCGGARRRRRERLWLYGCWSRIDVTALHSSLLLGSEDHLCASEAAISCLALRNRLARAACS